MVKDTQPDDPQDFSFSAGGGLSPGLFSLDDDGDNGNALSNSRTFSDLTPQSGYSVSENLALGFIQIAGTCSDGSPVSDINVAAGETVTCTFVNQRGYARPKGAGPHKVPLVPAFNECTSPNRVHGPSLESPSCNPPAASSPNVTIGTPDLNGAAANMNGSVAFRVFPGNAGTPEDEADVSVQVALSDIRLRSNATDYTGELQGQVVLQITDKASISTLSEATTMSNVPLNFTVPCTTTASTTIGSNCAINTTVDAMLPGAVIEGRRAIWEMGDVRVLDGGSDNDADTGPNSPYLRQGLIDSVAPAGALDPFRETRGKKTPRSPVWWS